MLRNLAEKFKPFNPMISTKKLIFVFIVFFSLIPVTKGVPIKIVLEIAAKVEKVQIKYTENNEITTVEPWKKDATTSFFIECDDLENTFIIAPVNSRYRLYSINHQQASQQFRLQSNETISLQEALTKYPAENAEVLIDEFVLANYLNEPIGGGPGNDSAAMRNSGNEDFYFKTPASAFLRNELIQFAWHSEGNVRCVKIFDLQEFNLLLKQDNYTDSIISWAQITAAALGNWKETGQYEISVETENQKYKQAFEITPLFFLPQSQAIVLTAEDIAISWQGDFTEYCVILTDEEKGTTIWKNAHFSGKTLTFAALGCNNCMEEQKNYRLTLQAKNEGGTIEISTRVKIVLSKEEYSELQDFIK